MRRPEHFPNLWWRVKCRWPCRRCAGLLDPHVTRSVPCIARRTYVRPSLMRALCPSTCARDVLSIQFPACSGWVGRSSKTHLAEQTKLSGAARHKKKGRREDSMFSQKEGRDEIARNVVVMDPRWFGKKKKNLSRTGQKGISWPFLEQPPPPPPPPPSSFSPNLSFLRVGVHSPFFLGGGSKRCPFFWVFGGGNWRLCVVMFYTGNLKKIPPSLSFHPSPPP